MAHLWQLLGRHIRTKGSEACAIYHNGIYATGHHEGKLTAEDIQSAANATNEATYPAILEKNSTLAESLGLTGTLGIIVMPRLNRDVQIRCLIFRWTCAARRQPTFFSI